MTVSADDAYVLVASEGHTRADLMLVEGFR